MPRPWTAVTTMALTTMALVLIGFALTANAESPSKASMERKTMTPTERAVLSTVTRMTNAFHAGDIDTVMSTYEPGATVVFEPGQPIESAATLRRLFSETTAIGPEFTYSAHEVFVAGDIALHLAPWVMRATLPDGTQVEESGLSVAVLRRQEDGAWLMVIDDPHGTATMP